jgi:hypothetical protein
MQARRLSETTVLPIQLSLRVRHPDIDPAEISGALELEPEHCFKAGAARAPREPGGIAGRHTQSYWLAPVTAEAWSAQVEPSMLAAAIASRPGWQSPPHDDETWRKSIRAANIEVVLAFFLKRLRSRQAFLQRLQSGGGDVSLIMLLDRESAADFGLPAAVSGQLAQLGIAVEFKFT